MAAPKKWALITGGAHRIGKALALACATKGYSILLHYNRSQSKALATKDEILAHGARCEIIQANLLDDVATKRFAEEIFQDQAIELLINNASLYPRLPLLQTTTEELRKMMQIHVIAPLLLTQALYHSQNSGIVINILDTAIRQHTDEAFAYLLSKKALAEQTLIAAKTLAPKVRVNGIAPGKILPPVERVEKDRATTIPTIALKRRGTVEEIALALNYLIDNAYVTGEILHVSGGL